MTQKKHIADGKTKIFHFKFPFFLKSDIVIEVDSQPATNYNLICKGNKTNADTPFIGGEVHFNKPPKLASVIKIKRKLSIGRIVDYQPTEKYNPTTHNQDMNYIIEILKDMRAEIDSVTVLPTDVSNKNTIETISEQVSEIASAMDEVINNPIQPGAAVDLSEINSAIETLNNSITTLNTKCTELDTQIENLPTTASFIPDYANGIHNTMTTTEQTYTCPSDGVIVADTTGFDWSQGYIKINGVAMFSVTTNGNSFFNGGGGQYIVAKNDVITYRSGYVNATVPASTNKLSFYPFRTNVNTSES